MCFYTTKIHSRRAASAVLDRLAATRNAGTPILHWFSGTQHELARAIELGCWFSVGPTMLASEKGRALAANMPRHRLLTETDGPFAQVDGRAALPWDSDLAVLALSQLWAKPLSNVRKQLIGNLRRLVTGSATSVVLPPLPPDAV